MLWVELVEHPSEVDYSVSGTVSGTMTYARETDGGLGIALFGATTYLVGGSVAGAGLLASAIEGEMYEELVGWGVLGVGVGVLTTAYAMARRANHYAWDQTATLTLRRGSVVIGELVVRDVYDAFSWSTLDEPREASGGKLWAYAARELATCIVADLEGAPATGALAEVTR
jgi:hypothetical protein